MVLICYIFSVACKQRFVNNLQTSQSFLSISYISTQQWNKMMFKVNSGRKLDSAVWQHFEYEKSTDKSRCLAPACGAYLKGKNATNLINHLKSKHKELTEAVVSAQSHKPK